MPTTKHAKLSAIKHPCRGGGRAAERPRGRDDGQAVAVARPSRRKSGCARLAFLCVHARSAYRFS